MNEAKIRLSQKEMELLIHADWILTKNTILQKARQLLEILLEKQKIHLHIPTPHLPEAVLKPSAKISKGENYKGLPYLVLDYPRCFDKENIFAIRTLFWWGNYFSMTLHLSGSYKKMFAGKIIAAYSSLTEKEFFCCVEDQEWEHHFERSNYIPLTELGKTGFEKQVHKSSFIKLAYKIPLQQWNDAPEILFACYKKIVEILVD